jgi:serine/threonine protein kinase
MSENWQRWEHEVVNGVFPLRRSVRNSGHSAVFLTEHKSKAIPEALLKLVPAIPTLKDAQLSHWSIASRLSHPCLVRLLDTGSCQLGGLSFLYVVTEYAEQTLAQILAQRVLEIEEFKKLMRPVLEGLSFLHRRQLVHGGLKPSNLLMFKERLKLASDAVRPAGESSASLAPASEFDPPETRDGSYSAAGDVWSLGVLIVEALTQKRPVWPDKMGGPVLPKSLPAALVGVVLRCLNRNPARRPTVEQLDAEINPMWPVHLASERSLLPAFAFAPGPVVNDLPVVQPPPVVFPRSEVQLAPVGRPEPTVTMPVIADASPEVAVTMPVVSNTGPRLAMTLPVASGASPQLAVVAPMASVANPQLAVVAPVASVANPQLAVVAPVASVANPQLAVAPPVASGVSPQLAVAPPVASGVSPQLAVAPPVASGVSPQLAVAPPVASGASPQLAVATPVASGVSPPLAVASSVASGLSPSLAVALPVPSGASPQLAVVTPVPSGANPGVISPAAGHFSVPAANEPIVEPTVVLKQPPKRGVFLVRAAMIVAGVLATGWIGAVMLSRQAPVPATAIPVAAAAVPAPPAPMQIKKPAQVEAPEVAASQPDPRSAVHEEIPDVPDKALATIHGRMLFAIRVTVDPEGRIVHAVPVGSQASKYFVRLCTGAAMRWKFAPADTIAARKWLVHFEFTRSGVVAHAT